MSYIGREQLQYAVWRALLHRRQNSHASFLPTDSVKIRHNEINTSVIRKPRHDLSTGNSMQDIRRCRHVWAAYAQLLNLRIFLMFALLSLCM